MGGLGEDTSVLERCTAASGRIKGPCHSVLRLMVTTLKSPYCTSAQASAISLNANSLGIAHGRVFSIYAIAGSRVCIGSQLIMSRAHVSAYSCNCTGCARAFFLTFVFGRATHAVLIDITWRGL